MPERWGGKDGPPLPGLVGQILGSFVSRTEDLHCGYGNPSLLTHIGLGVFQLLGM